MGADQLGILPVDRLKKYVILKLSCYFINAFFLMKTNIFTTAGQKIGDLSPRAVAFMFWYSLWYLPQGR